MSSWIQRLPAYLASGLPTALVLGALAGVAAWGSAHDWRLGKPPRRETSEEEKKPKEEGGPGMPSVSLDSAESARKAGIAVTEARQRPVSYQVTAPGVLAFDQTQYAHLSTRAPGTAWRVLRQAGDPVKKGDVLALVAAAEVGRIKAELQTAHLQVELRTKLLQRYQAAAGSIPERQIRDAQMSLREARVQLLNAQQALASLGLVIRPEDLAGLPDEVVAGRLRRLGVPPDLVKQMDPAALPNNLLPMTAPFDGVVIRRDVVAGEVVDSSRPQFVVANVDWVWALLDVRLEDAGRVEVGQEVTFQSDAAGQTASGEVTWVSAEVDPKTRTVRARARVRNYAGRLRPGTFGTGRIVVWRNPQALTVPDAAVQWDGRSHLVFVREEESRGKEYRACLVLPGTRAGGYTELRDPRALFPAATVGLLASGGPLRAAAPLPVTEAAFAGVRPGDVVVTTGSQVLKSELLKSRIGGED
jgi:cobalt-zinc-cadmium efflux system membrane fusion protein